MNRGGEYVLHYIHYVAFSRENGKVRKGGGRESLKLQEKAATARQGSRDIWLKGDPFFALAP